MHPLLSVIATVLLVAMAPPPSVAQDNLVQQGDARSLVTDEPRYPVGKPEDAPEYVATPEPSAGQHLALTLQKLQQGFDPPRPFLIWALGSSYTNMLGNGEAWIEEIPKRFPQAPPIQYQKMVGNSCPWQYLRGWARHLAVPDQPDLVLIYTIGKPENLEKLILELRRHTTADIIVPSIHWRVGDTDLWGKSENSPQQVVAAVREVCRKHGVEFVENRRAWGQYLQDNQLPIPALLKDAVHQSDYGAKIINANILAHLKQPPRFSYDPTSREYPIEPMRREDGVFQVTFVGNRIDLVGRKSPTGGKLAVRINGQPADQVQAYLMSYVQPSNQNARVGRGSNPRDQSPHGITLGENIVPQRWRIVMTSDEGDYALTGSITGGDGKGNAFADFTSDSGQIRIESELWRRAERNRTGDLFEFEVRRSVLSEIDFQGADQERFAVRIAQVLPSGPEGRHTLELMPTGGAEFDAGLVEYFRAFRPPMFGQE